MTQKISKAEHKRQLEGIANRRGIVPEFLQEEIEALEE